jgi:hypothetical protein
MYIGNSAELLGQMDESISFPPAIEELSLKNPVHGPDSTERPQVSAVGEATLHISVATFKNIELFKHIRLRESVPADQLRERTAILRRSFF